MKLYVNYTFIHIALFHGFGSITKTNFMLQITLIKKKNL